MKTAPGFIEETVSRIKFGGPSADQPFGADFTLTLLCRRDGKFDVEHDDF